MLQDQINKRNLMMGTWLTAFAAVFAFTIKKDGALASQQLVLLGGLVLFSILTDVALITMVVWQNRYKRACTVISCLIMSDTDLSQTKNVFEYIKDWYVVGESKSVDRDALGTERKRFPFSTTNIIMLFCHLMPCMPAAIILEHLGYLWTWMPYYIGSTCAYVAILSIFHWWWNKKQRYKVPWILRISGTSRTPANGKQTASQTSSASSGAA